MHILSLTMSSKHQGVKLLGLISKFYKLVYTAVNIDLWVVYIMYISICMKVLMDNYLFIEDGPKHCANNCYAEGNSPNILNNFITFLKSNIDNIDTIYACMFLYNNPILHEEFIKFANAGIKVNVISIPLEGYDKDTFKKIIYYKSSNKSDDLNRKYKLSEEHSKYTLAKLIYKDIENNAADHFRFYIFPHIYIRSSNIKDFSRGNLPYSLHAKSFFIKTKEGVDKIAITSSNLATIDQVKNEVMIIANCSNDEAMNSSYFFKELISNSVSLEKADSIDTYRYKIIPKHYTQTENNGYTAPFLKGSQNILKKLLIDMFMTARERIWITAEHICAYQCEGILYHAIEAAKKGVSVKCLSQTFVYNDGKSHGLREPANKGAYTEFINEFSKTINCNYAVNASAHSKYIIVDNIAVVCTANFTPTQFIYKENVNIKFGNIDYKGIFSEVSHYIKINDQDTVNLLIDDFESVWNSPSTTKMKKCKSCGKYLIRRTGKYGKFLGCTGYPECTYSEN